MCLQVLVVDDDHVNRKLVAVMLRKLSCSVTTTESAVQALEVLGIADTSNFNTNKSFDAVISDFVMPEMTGLHLLQKMKASALHDVPVVIMSSDNIQDRINRCLKEGAEMYVLKPLRLETLQAFIKKDHN